MYCPGLSQPRSLGGAPGVPAITGVGSAVTDGAGLGLERPGAGEACLVVDEPAEQAARASTAAHPPASASRAERAAIRGCPYRANADQVRQSSSRQAVC